MAFEAICPSCSATFNLRDDLQGKKVRCAKCDHVFLVGGKARTRASEEEGVAPRAAARKNAREDDEDARGEARGKKKRVYHDGDDDDRPRKRARKATGSGAGTIAAIVGGVGLLLLLMCLGGGYAIYAVMRQGVAQVERAAVVANNADNAPLAGAPVNPVNPFNPLVQPKIRDLDEALRELKAADAKTRQEAAVWLSRAPLDAARQREVAQALEPLLNEPDNNSRYAAMRALKTWATPESVPALAKALDEQKLDGIPNDANKDAMAAIGRLKDVRGADAVARFLPQFFLREDAARVLQQMGPVAEKAVLRYYHHRDGGAREKARALVQGYGTKEAALIAQSEQDVRQGSERDTRRDAARWLKAVRVDAEQQKAVAATLAAALADTDREVADAAMDALDTWAWADTVPALVKLVEDPAVGGRRDDQRRKAMLLLGKLKDPRAAEPVAARLTYLGDRRTAGDALIAMGAIAKPATEKYVTSPDPGVRREAERVLASLGADPGALKISQILTDLASPEGRRRADAARTLTTMKVDATQQAKVGKALESAALDASDRFAQDLAVKALAVWGTKENGPTLVKMIGEEKLKHPANVRHAAMDLLAQWKDEAAIKAIALNIGPDRGDRDAAGKALLAMGPDLGDKIEAAVWPGLQNADKAVILECVRILGAVGTKASNAELNKLGQLAVKQKQGDVAAACRKALLEIAGRGK